MVKENLWEYLSVRSKSYSYRCFSLSRVDYFLFSYFSYESPLEILIIQSHVWNTINFTWSHISRLTMFRDFYCRSLRINLN